MCLSQGLLAERKNKLLKLKSRKLKEQGLDYSLK